jgi:hypothetical protein
VRVLLVLFESKAAGVTASTGALALTAFDRALQQAGVLLTHGRLVGSAPGGLVTFAGGRAHDMDNVPACGINASPTGDLVHGATAYWLLQVASRDVALAWAARFPAGAGARLAVWPVQDDLDRPDG